MCKTHYFIVGEDVQDGFMMLWNKERGWIDTSELSEATAFDREVLTSTLPIGAEGILETTEDNAEMVQYYKVMPLV